MHVGGYPGSRQRPGRGRAPAGVSRRCSRHPGSRRLTSLDIGDGPPQVLLGHQLADDHQQVKLAV